MRNPLAFCTGAKVVPLRHADAGRARPDLCGGGGSRRAREDVKVGRVNVLMLPDDQLGVGLLGGNFLHRLPRFAVADGTRVLEN